MSINYRYDDGEAYQKTLTVQDASDKAYFEIETSIDGHPHDTLLITLPPDEQLKLFQALAAHLAGPDSQSERDVITQWLTSSFEPDYLLVMARNLISHALAANGEAGFAPGEPTENLGEWSENEQT